MLLHPFESLELILDTVVETSALLNFFTGEKPEWPHAVVEGHHDDIVIRCFDQVRSVVIGIRKLCEASALEKEVNREVLPGGDGVGWSVDVHK